MIKQLYVQVCVCVSLQMYGCKCVNVKAAVAFIIIQAASASIGDSRTSICPEGLLSQPKSCPNAPVMDPLLPHPDNPSPPNIHPVNTAVKSTLQLFLMLWYQEWIQLVLISLTLMVMITLIITEPFFFCLYYF